MCPSRHPEVLGSSADRGRRRRSRLARPLAAFLLTLAYRSWVETGVDEVEDDSYAASSDVEESVEAQAVGTVDAAEDEKSSGTVSTRALEIFLIVLVVIAVVVLAALALVVFNPFS